MLIASQPSAAPSLRVEKLSSPSRSTSASAASTMRSRLSGARRRGARRGAVAILAILQRKDIIAQQTYTVKEAAMDAVDLIGLAVPLTYFALLAAEKRWPARRFPPRRGWQWIGVGFLLLIGTA